MKIAARKEAFSTASTLEFTDPGRRATPAVAGPVQRRVGHHCLPCTLAKPKMTSSNEAATQAAHRAFAPSTNLIAARTITADKTNDQGKNFGLSYAMTGNPAATRTSNPATRDRKRRCRMRGSSCGASTKMRKNMNTIPPRKRMTVAPRNAATTSVSTDYDPQRGGVKRHRRAERDRPLAAWRARRAGLALRPWPQGDDLNAGLDGAQRRTTPVRAA